MKKTLLKLLDKKTMLKIMGGVFLAFIVRFIAIYLGLNSMDSIWWIENNFIFGLISLTIASGKELINSWVESLNISKEPLKLTNWLIELHKKLIKLIKTLIESFSEFVKNKHTIGNIDERKVNNVNYMEANNSSGAPVSYEDKCSNLRNAKYIPEDTPAEDKWQILENKYNQNGTGDLLLKTQKDEVDGLAKGNPTPIMKLTDEITDNALIRKVDPSIIRQKLSDYHETLKAEHMAYLQISTFSNHIVSCLVKYNLDLEITEVSRKDIININRLLKICGGDNNYDIRDLNRVMKGTAHLYQDREVRITVEQAIQLFTNMRENNRLLYRVLSIYDEENSRFVRNFIWRADMQERYRNVSTTKLRNLNHSVAYSDYIIDCGVAAFKAERERVTGR